MYAKNKNVNHQVLIARELMFVGRKAIHCEIHKPILLNFTIQYNLLP
jgi:hypothetical protein